ncbi:MAG: hypothetical protein LBD13_06650, partial [Spirochaetaceae bacterium]|nr:hypothetical protein [Spirochaetaceae bacterium]
MKRAGDTREAGILAAWILGPLLIGGLLWFFTQPLRAELLQEQVNALLGERYALDPALPPAALPKTRLPLGTWYALRDSAQRA